MRRSRTAAVVVSAILVAGCGSSGKASSSQQNGSSSGGIPASSPFSGKTIRLISSGAAGSTHDLAARAIAPYLGQYLHATVDVVDMPGGGQLEAWNYVSAAKPDGLTIGTLDIQGVLANVWEKVPNQKFDVSKLSYLGFVAGGVGPGSKVLFSINSSKPPLTDIFSVLSDKTTQLRALGSVGDVSVPMLFKIYGVDYEDLTTYSGSLAELQGILRGDGQLSSKTWGGSWASFVTSGKGKVLLAFTMRQHWPVDNSVPTLATVLAKDPPKSSDEVAALKANASALDGGMGLFGPANIPSKDLSALEAAIKWAVAQPGFIAASEKAKLSTVYESPAAELAAIKAGLSPATVATIRKFVPLSTGVAS
jgi:tripartite-type tricarboxylate transporter receptor subunit TctC